MSMKIVGKQKVDYVSKKTNQPVVGVTLHCVADTNDERFEGMRTETIFVSNRSAMYEQCRAFPLESEIFVSYNRYGSVESVVLADQKK